MRRSLQGTLGRADEEECWLGCWGLTVSIVPVPTLSRTSHCEDVVLDSINLCF